MENRLLNLRSGVLHRYPAFESCNIDAIPLQFRLTFRHTGERIDDPVLRNRGYKADCRRCFTEQE